MQIRQFGSTELRVSALGLGCARIGGIFQGNADEFLRLLHVARDAGLNFFDTADMYSQGESESLIGRAFRGRRHDVIIASKVGYRLPAQRMFVARLKPLLRPVIRRLGLRRTQVPKAVQGALAQDFSPSYLRAAVDGSLRRLRTDYLDILQLHSPPLDVVERGDWVATLEALKAAGKIRYFGVAGEGNDVGVAALRHAAVASLQFTLNLLEQGAADTLVPAARERGLGLIARECLANGLLVKRASEIDLARYCRTPEQVADRTAQLARYRSEAGGDIGQLTRNAIAYVQGVPGVSVTLLGARSVDQLRDLLALLPS